MFRFIVLSLLVVGVACSKKEKEKLPETSTQTPPQASTQSAYEPTPSTQPKTEVAVEAKTKTNTKTQNTKPVEPEAAETKEAAAPKTEAQATPKVEEKKPTKTVAVPKNQQTVTLTAGQFKSMEFAGNTKPLVNGGTSQIYKLSDISRLKLLGVRFELNLSKVPLDHIVSFTYAGRFDINLTTDTGLRKICGEGFAETPVQVKGRKPGRALEITFPRVVLSTVIGEDDCATSVSKSQLSTPVAFTITPVDGKTQMEVIIHEPVQVTITDSLNEVVAPGTYPVGFNVILQTEISN